MWETFIDNISSIWKTSKKIWTSFSKNLIDFESNVKFTYEKLMEKVHSLDRSHKS